MREPLAEILAGQEAYVVGGAIRDELLGRRVVDLDVACPEPRPTANRYRERSGGAVFPLSERHGAWRVALTDGRTVDFTPLRGTIEEDLAARDFTINAIAEPVAGGAYVDPFAGRVDLRERRLRAVSDSIFLDDPLRLLRAVRLVQELGLQLDPHAADLVRRDRALVSRPAGERVLAELDRLSREGWQMLAELGLLEHMGGAPDRLRELPERARGDLVLTAALGEGALQLPISNERRRLVRTLLSAAAPADDSPRAIHRFRRATEPWALETLVYLGARDYAPAVERARKDEPAEPLVRGHELGLPAGPAVGRALEAIAEERAAGTISTRAEALALAHRIAELGP